MITYMQLTHVTSNMNIVEIGTYKGDSAKIFASHFRRVLCVDAWEQDIFNVPGTSVADAERAFDDVCLVHHNIQKFKGRSTEVAQREYFKDAHFDVVYIDASHDYENVRHDILSWRSKARVFICGHDYWKGKFDGVIEAVNETLGKPIKVFVDTSWLVAL